MAYTLHYYTMLLKSALNKLNTLRLESRFLTTRTEQHSLFVTNIKEGLPSFRHAYHILNNTDSCCDN